ncbi:hypothetical protein D1007_02544 [Hordeum vulgare]|nr:hypothetical protein D1007_02544 [Hordeum vulgare]
MPPAPQVEGCRGCSGCGSGQHRAALVEPLEALALVGEDVFLRRGPLTNVVDILAQLKVDFWDAEEAAKGREVKLVDRDSELAKAVAEVRDAHAKQVSEANAKLTAQEQEIHAAADAKVAADCVALYSLELRAREAVRSICRLGLESPSIPPDTGNAKLSAELVKQLEGATKKVDNILEEECRDLFSLAATHVFGHLLLRDPHFEFEEVVGPVPEESCSDLATSVEGHVNTLLGKLFCDDGEEPSKEPLALP